MRATARPARLGRVSGDDDPRGTLAQQPLDVGLGRSCAAAAWLTRDSPAMPSASATAVRAGESVARSPRTTGARVTSVVVVPLLRPGRRPARSGTTTEVLEVLERPKGRNRTTASTEDPANP
jgi:hypothetical protein